MYTKKILLLLSIGFGLALFSSEETVLAQQNNVSTMTVGLPSTSSMSRSVTPAGEGGNNGSGSSGSINGSSSSNPTVSTTFTIPASKYLVGLFNDIDNSGVLTVTRRLGSQGQIDRICLAATPTETCVFIDDILEKMICDIKKEIYHSEIVTPNSFSRELCNTADSSDSQEKMTESNATGRLKDKLTAAKEIITELEISIADIKKAVDYYYW